MNRLALSLLGSLAAASPATLASNFPVRAGERLSYRVAWAVVPGAGQIEISARQEVAAGAPRLAITTTTATRRLARVLLPFDAAATSRFDLSSGRLLELHETSTQRTRRSEHRVTFDYTARQATYTGGKRGDQPYLIPIPDGNPTDLIMGLLQTRTWDLPPGGKRDALVLFNDEFYELTLYHLGAETVRTPLGRFDTIVLEPRMEKTPPKGMFKRGSTVRVWIAQDALRLPVKFEVEFKIGTGTAILESYDGPTSSAAAPPSPDAQNPRP